MTPTGRIQRVTPGGIAYHGHLIIGPDQYSVEGIRHAKVITLTFRTPYGRVVAKAPLALRDEQWRCDVALHGFPWALRGVPVAEGGAVHLQISGEPAQRDALVDDGVVPF